MHGLTYYIRCNKFQTNRADFHIAQKVGSMQEEEALWTGALFGNTWLLMEPKLPRQSDERLSGEDCVYPELI